jgi:hypothetical protein
MNQSKQLKARRPLAAAAAAALLLNAAALASLSRLPTRGERLLADADAQPPAAAMYAAMAGHSGLHTRLTRLVQHWLSLGTRPAAAHGAV